MTAFTSPARQRHVLVVKPGNRLHPVLAAVHLRASHIAQDIDSYRRSSAYSMCPSRNQTTLPSTYKRVAWPSSRAIISGPATMPCRDCCPASLTWIHRSLYQLQRLAYFRSLSRFLGHPAYSARTQYRNGWFLHRRRFCRSFSHLRSLERPLLWLRLAGSYLPGQG
jgi:hypothetical protein